MRQVLRRSEGVPAQLAGPLFGYGGYPLLAVTAGLLALVPLAAHSRR